MKKITQKEMSSIVDMWGAHSDGTPRGQFYSFENGVWVGCDNSTGDCWMEEFRTEQDVIKWLNGERVCDYHGYLHN